MIPSRKTGHFARSVRRSGHLGERYTLQGPCLGGGVAPTCSHRSCLSAPHVTRRPSGPPDKPGTAPSVRSKDVPPPWSGVAPAFGCCLPNQVRSGVRHPTRGTPQPPTVPHLSLFKIKVSNSNATEASILPCVLFPLPGHLEHYPHQAHCSIPLHSSENELWTFSPE